MYKSVFITIYAHAYIYRDGALLLFIYMTLTGYVIYTKLGVLVCACIVLLLHQY